MLGRVSLSFQDQLAFGEEGEKSIAEMLINRGVSILPLYQFKNHDQTPFLLTREEKLTMPDLTCWKNGDAYFVECKRKNKWVHFNGQMETGLNLKHFKEYEKIKALTNLDVWLFFLHEHDHPGIYFEEIHAIKPLARVWDGTVKGKRIEKPLILFPRDALKRFNLEIAA